jgi:hypothetical protein
MSVDGLGNLKCLNFDQNIPMRFSLLFAFLFTAFASLSAQTGQWTILKTRDQVANRNECGMVAVKGNLYVIGGDRSGSRSLESLSLKTLKWTKHADAPVDMHHFQAVTDQQKIYVLEAFSEGGFPDQIPMANVLIYNIATDTWTQGAKIPEARRRAGAGAAAYGGKFYLVAGIQHGHSSGTTNMFDEYDPKTNKWKVLPNAPNIRDHASAAVINDKLYAVGGRNTSYHEPDNFMAFFSHTVTEVDCYDFKSGTWSTLPAKLPLGSGGGAAVNYNDRLYYMGGERATETARNGPQKNVYMLDPATSEPWKEIESLNLPRNGMAAAVSNNAIYIACGSGGGPGGPPPGGQKGPEMKKDGGAPPPTPLPPPPGGQGASKDKLVVEVFKLK